MTYREFAPPAPLRGLAECSWMQCSSMQCSSMQGPSRLLAPEVYDVLPDGCMDLVWSGAELFVAGPDTAPHPYRREPGLEPAGLRFAPGRLSPLLRVPASALRDDRVLLAELHPALAGRATARLERGDPPAAVLADLALALPGDAPDASVGAVLRRLRGGASAAATADALGWTTRSLHRHCVGWFGYGPAVLRRILRFRAAAALLRAGVPPADAAARTGYADQPHLSREVRALAGIAPSQLASGA